MAVAYAKEGAKVVMVYLNEHEDAAHTQREIILAGQPCLLFAGDVADESFCRAVVEQTLEQWGQLDILVNNAGSSIVNYPQHGCRCTAVFRTGPKNHARCEPLQHGVLTA